MIYLATPYSHPRLSVRCKRYYKAMDLVYYLTCEAGSEVVYSPIVAWHPLARRHTLPEGHEFWRSIDEQMIDVAHKIYFAMIGGWEDSKGMKREYQYALIQGKPIYRLETRHDCILVAKQIGPLYE